MLADVKIVHEATGVRAVIPAGVLPGWLRLGWVLAADVDQPAPAAGSASILTSELRRRVRPAPHPKPPAIRPGTPDDLAAGSSHSPEGVQR